MPPRVFSSPQEAADAAARCLVAALENVINPTLALSGGRAGELALQALARLKPTAIDFFWADERRVPPDHPRSNFGLAKRLLLDPLNVPSDRRHPLVDSTRAEKELQRRAPDGFSAVLLGLGEDGHTASLFPGSPALTSTAWVAETQAPDGEARLTLTPAFLTKAGTIVVLATGPTKAIAVKRALDGEDLPINAVAGRAAWFLDRAAASLL